MKGFAPTLLKFGPEIPRFPVRPDDFVISAKRRQLQHGAQQLVRRFRLVKGSDQRLNDADRAIKCSGIAPALEKMRFGQMPYALCGGLIEFQSKVNRLANFFK